MSGALSQIEVGWVRAIKAETHIRIATALNADPNALQKSDDAAAAARTCPVCGVTTEMVAAARYCGACAERISGLRWSAMRAVARAVRNGSLPPARSLRCVDCGDVADHYDHRDYAVPLHVEPVCRACNYRRGPAVQLFDGALTRSQIAGR